MGNVNFFHKIFALAYIAILFIGAAFANSGYEALSSEDETLGEAIGSIIVLIFALTIWLGLHIIALVVGIIAKIWKQGRFVLISSTIALLANAIFFPGVFIRYGFENSFDELQGAIIILTIPIVLHGLMIYNGFSNVKT